MREEGRQGQWAYEDSGLWGWVRSRLRRCHDLATSCSRSSMRSTTSTRRTGRSRGGCASSLCGAHRALLQTQRAHGQAEAAWARRPELRARRLPRVRAGCVRVFMSVCVGDTRMHKPAHAARHRYAAACGRALGWRVGGSGEGAAVKVACGTAEASWCAGTDTAGGTACRNGWSEHPSIVHLSRRLRAPAGCPPSCVPG